VDVTDAGVKVQQIVTKIPHWYNVEYLEKNGIVPEAGAYIRSKVPVTSKKITDQLRAEEARIRKAYGNVRIHTVPELVDSSVPETILRGSSDKEKVEQYVAATILEEARFEAGQAVGYMVSKLDGLKEGALGGEIRFVGVEADNVLVFDKVRLKLSKLGLVLVKGVNEDWPGRSNGCLAKGTLIDIPRDFRKWPNGVPIETLVGKENFLVYSYDAVKGIVLKRASWAACTGQRVPVLRIRFKETFGRPNGRRLPWIGELKCTPDHLIMLRDGTWKRADALKAGDRVMPLHRRYVSGYYQIADNKGRIEEEHRMILEAVFGAPPSGDAHGHHCDESKINNDPSNLEWKTEHDHYADHARDRNLDGGDFGWQNTSREHPRGMAGKHHSKKTKKAQSAKNTVRWIEWRQMWRADKGLTPEVLKDLYLHQGRTLKEIAEMYGTFYAKIRDFLKDDGNYIANNHKVIAVESGGVSDVYDIHVPETHSFVANGVVVHNSGKTSLLSLIPIAMFGQTNKGQKSDAWACENNDAAATVRLILRDVAGRKIEILRGRRPHYIRLLIDGEDKSAGITGLRKNETQGLIEKVTGYDLRMLMNAVYIDQSIANGFIFGTPSGRMDLISRFQNLERFELAQKDVSSDIKKYDEALANYTTQIDSLAEDIDDLESVLKELAGSTQTDWKKQLVAEQSALAGLIAEHAAVAGAAQAYEELQRTIDDLEIDRQREADAYEDKARVVSVLKDRVESGQSLIKAGKCPTCSQPSATVGAALVKQSTAKLKDEEVSAERHRLAKVDAETKKKDAAKRLQRYEQSKDDLERQIKRSRERLADLQKAADEEAGRNKAAAEKTQVKTTELNLKRRYHHAALGARQALSIEMEMLEFSKKAFHRTGIPLYLSMALCPLLNKAADEYSDVFTDGNLKVSFRVEDGEFAVDIVNPSGSATVDGQSIGESAMAGIVVAFALREAAPKTNLLVMDEPGTGLDPEGCKAFARGILRLKDRFETMILVSHSPYISGLLEGETVYTVNKREGRSRLLLSSGAKEK
jgi:hypothetical protein